MLTKIAPYWKAVAGVGVPFLTALGFALADDHVTAAEWVRIGTVTLTTGGAVFLVPNKAA